MKFFSGLDELVRKGDLSAVDRALRDETNVNKPAKSQGKLRRKPLHAAVVGGQLDMVELLIRRGADLNARDQAGQTALHYAAHLGHRSAVEVLLNSGADHTIRDVRGNLPIHIATLSRHVSIQEMLRQHAIEHPLEVCYFEGGRWQPYDQSNASAVSLELGEGSAYCALVTSSGTAYIVDFFQQMQINATSFFVKSIAWRTTPLGHWNYPITPIQGLHPGSQDPRYLQRYTPLLQSLRAQGLIPPATLPPWPTGSAEYQQQSLHTSPSPSSSGVQYPRIDSSAPPLPLSPTLNHTPPPPSSSLLGRSYSLEGSPNSPSMEEDRLLRPPRASAPPMPNPSPSSQAHFANARPTMFKALRSGSEVYNEVAARFIKGMQKPKRRSQGSSTLQVEPVDELRPVSVSRVYEIQAPAERVEAYERALGDRKSVRGTANEKMAWHGAPFQSLEGIVLKGFKVNPDGRQGRLYGQGVYFAPEGRAYTSAEFAVADEHGEKHMLLCRLITGAMEVIPFESAQNGPSSSKYDTGTDNLEEPSRYIVWEDDVNEHVLPTHLVSFRYC